MAKQHYRWLIGEGASSTIGFLGNCLSRSPHYTVGATGTPSAKLAIPIGPLFQHLHWICLGVPARAARHQCVLRQSPANLRSCQPHERCKGQKFALVIIRCLLKTNLTESELTYLLAKADKRQVPKQGCSVPLARVEPSVRRDDCPLDKENKNYSMSLSVRSEQILLAHSSCPD